MPVTNLQSYWLGTTAPTRSTAALLAPTRGVVRTSQPQQATPVDLGNQIAAAFRRGFVVNFIERGRIGNVSITDTTARAAAQGGVGLSLQSGVAPGTTVPAADARWISSATQATFLCVFTPLSVPTGTTEERLFCRWGLGTTNDQFIVQMRGPNFGVAARGASVEARQTSGITLAPGTQYVCVATWNANRTGVDRHRFWINGRQFTAVDWFVNGSTSSLSDSTAATNLVFGADHGGTTNRATNSVLQAAGVTPVDIGDAAALALSANPWQLFLPQPNRVMVPA